MGLGGGALYRLVFPCIPLYLFCIALYFLVFVLYASYCLVLPRIALGALRPVSWQVVRLVRFVFFGPASLGRTITVVCRAVGRLAHTVAFSVRIQMVPLRVGAAPVSKGG